MQNLWTEAERIIENDRHAGHGQLTVWAALHYVEETGSINGAVRALQDVRSSGAPPRWLIARWCNDAFTNRPHTNTP